MRTSITKFTNSLAFSDKYWPSTRKVIESAFSFQTKDWVINDNYVDMGKYRQLPDVSFIMDMRNELTDDICLRSALNTGIIQPRTRHILEAQRHVFNNLLVLDLLGFNIKNSSMKSVMNQLQVTENICEQLYDIYVVVE